MGERIPRSYFYAVAVLIAVIGALLFWNSVREGNKGPDDLASALEKKSKELEEREQQIRALGDQVARLRKEVEASYRKVAELQGRLEQVGKALPPPREKIAEPVQTTSRAEEKSPEPSPAPNWRRPAEPGTYEAVRSTPVFAEPDAASRKVSAIKRGARVQVVRSVGEWLEVRSKHGNPPGFIRRDDAMFVEK
jgi:chromosome segregation ATPase